LNDPTRERVRFWAAVAQVVVGIGFIVTAALAGGSLSALGFVGGGLGIIGGAILLYGIRRARPFKNSN
jgi:hypothetical protein